MLFFSVLFQFCRIPLPNVFVFFLAFNNMFRFEILMPFKIWKVVWSTLTTTSCGFNRIDILIGKKWKTLYHILIVRYFFHFNWCTKWKTLYHIVLRWYYQEPCVQGRLKNSKQNYGLCSIFEIWTLITCKFCFFLYKLFGPYITTSNFQLVY